MQVRKFEAKSIKEAIDLVKFHLGPDAIILSAKENTRGFGLVGEASVEVTAAVAESKLRKKQAAEKKLNSQSMRKYQGASARAQKQFIDKSSDEDMLNAEFADREGGSAPRAPKPQPRPRERVTTVPYVNITDETDVSEGAVRPAALVPRSAPVEIGVNVGSAIGNAAQLPAKYSALQNEVTYLKGVLSQFQSVPQNIVSLHPGAEDGLPYELSFIFKKLLDAGVSHEHIVEILKIASDVLPLQQKKKKALVEGWVIKHMLDHLQIATKRFSSKLQIFIGPTGQGKTSTLVKMACHLMMKEKKRIALLTGDYVKVGAIDQIRIYSQILNVPSAVVSKAQDWVNLEPALNSVDYILLDTPGVNLRGPNDLELLKSVLPMNLANAQIHYVQSIMARDIDACEVARRFQVIGFHDVIFTRLDEAVQFGLIFNFQKNFNTATHSFGIGNAIPEDYEFATKERIVDLIFNLSNFRKERGL